MKNSKMVQTYSRIFKSLQYDQTHFRGEIGRGQLFKLSFPEVRI